WLSTITYPQGTLTRSYDSHTGQLSSLASPSGETTTFAYDGSLLKSITWMGPVPGSLTLSFDNNFRVMSQAINGTSLSVGYDLDGLMTQAGSIAIVKDLTNGRLTGTTLGNLSDSYTYDTNGLLASYTATYTVSGSSTMLYQESIAQRDNLGRITQKT